MLLLPRFIFMLHILFLIFLHDYTSIYFTAPLPSYAMPLIYTILGVWILHIYYEKPKDFSHDCALVSYANQKNSYFYMSWVAYLKFSVLIRRTLFY